MCVCLSGCVQGLGCKVCSRGLKGLFNVCVHVYVCVCVCARARACEFKV